MLYKLLPLVLLLAVAADASAQTAPVRKTQTAPTNARRAPAKTTPRIKAASQQRSAAATTTATGTMSATPASTTTSQTQNIYAAPGQPIIVQEGKVEPYDGPAARRKTTKSSTTLSPR